MTLRLYNTLTKTKDDFVAARSEECAHVCLRADGLRLRPYRQCAARSIVFDVLFRLLRHVYGDAHVTYVRNITDVDDKINARARPSAASTASAS